MNGPSSRSGSRCARSTAAMAWAAAVLSLASGAWACPFCTVESQTLSEEINAADAAVLARLVREAAPIDAQGGFGAADPTTGDALFQVVDVLHGPKSIAEGEQISVVYFGEPDRKQTFMVTGIAGGPTGDDAAAIDWTTPLPLSAVAVDYVRQLATVPPAGADRLAFFQDYLEHDDPLLAQDAYDEFARAPYQELVDLADRMHHDRLVEWITGSEVSPSRRRLYLTMLGVCGSQADVPLLEEMILSDYATKKPFVEQLVSVGLALGGPIELPVWIELVKLDERRKKLGLDALVACYLVLRGPEGLDLIDERFLRNPAAEYTHVYATIMALRFHGESTDVVPQERLLASVRLLLDNADFADQVIPDLSRWEDWSVLDRLVEMFKSADENSYIRQPVVTYLTVASDVEGDVGRRATAALEELEAIDPEAVEHARSLMAFGVLARARSSDPPAGATRPADDTVEADPSDIVPVEDGEVVDELPDESPAAEEPPAADPTEAPTGPAGQLAANTAEQVPNRLLVIVVPLAATILLAGLYWLILRSGAV